MRHSDGGDRAGESLCGADVRRVRTDLPDCHGARASERDEAGGRAAVSEFPVDDPGRRYYPATVPDLYLPAGNFIRDAGQCASHRGRFRASGGVSLQDRAVFPPVL